MLGYLLLSSIIITLILSFFLYFKNHCVIKTEYLEIAGNMAICLIMICVVNKLFKKVGERNTDSMCGDERTQSLRRWNKGFNKAIASG